MGGRIKKCMLFLKTFLSSHLLNVMEKPILSKKPPEMTWQDKAILIVIPLVVFMIFIAANYFTKEPTVSEAFVKKTKKEAIRDGGNIISLLPDEGSAGATVQVCRLQSRDGTASFTFRYNVQATDTLELQVGRLLQFYGEYKYDPNGGTVEAPFKGKSGRITGWVIYGNKRYFNTKDEGSEAPGL